MLNDSAHTMGKPEADINYYMTASGTVPSDQHALQPLKKYPGKQTG